MPFRQVLGLLLDQNSTQQNPETGSGPHDPISDAALNYVDMYLSGVATSLLSLFGIVSNIVNFTVFMKQKSNDCVTICLRSLTVSDFCAMVATLIGGLSGLINFVNPGMTINPADLVYLMTWFRPLFFDISMGTTAFVSVERCLCVVMPFHFKNVFTTRVALITLFIIYVFNIASYMPVYVTQGLSSQWDPVYNKTRYMLWVSDNKDEIDKFSNIFTHIVISTILQTIVITSTQVMVIGLRRSARFRRRMMTKTNEAGQNVPAMEAGNAVSLANNNSADASKGGMEAKTRSVSKMVSILATIFIFCNFWRLIVVYARRIFPNLGPVKPLRNSYLTMLGIWQFVGAFNCSVNCFVYYAHSSSYRSIFLATFCACRANASPPLKKDTQ